jgi:hypothetical protein
MQGGVKMLEPILTSWTVAPLRQNTSTLTSGTFLAKYELRDPALDPS